MSKQGFPLSRVYGLLESGPVVRLTTAERGKANIMTLSWHCTHQGVRRQPGMPAGR